MLLPIPAPVASFTLNGRDQAALDNSKALLLPKWSSALAKVQAGSANATVLCIGGSTTLGLHSDGGTGDAYALSSEQQLANLLTLAGINAHQNTWFGDGDAFVSHGNNPRLSLGGAWARAAFAFGIGGYAITAGSAGTLAYTPSFATDTCDIWYGDIAGTFKANVNGGTDSTSTSGATQNYLKFTVSSTLGMNTYNVKWNSGNNFIQGMVAYDSSKKWAHIINAGWNGGNSSQMAQVGQAYSPGSSISQISPDLVLLEAGVINDWCQSIGIATTQANLQTLISSVTTGDVVIVTPNPSNPGVSSAPALSVQAQYVAMEQGLAVTNRCALIDIFNEFVSYPNSNSYGLYYDGLHPNGAGYGKIARAYLRALNI